METPKSLGVGTLPAGGTAATSVGPGSPPFTLQLNSTAAGRSIGISANAGDSFVTLTPTATSTGSIVALFNGPIGQVLFSGNAGDEYIAL